MGRDKDWMLDDWNNTTLPNIDVTSGTLTMTTTSIGRIVRGRTSSSMRYMTMASQMLLTLVYLSGVLGNISALVILFLQDKRRNRKHLLMMRCLVTNDLVALLGMLVQMYVTIYATSVTTSRAFCSLRIVWRLFGLFSGCVAIVMAVERWLALTQPFVYQKRVTFPVIIRCILALWLVAVTLTTLPLFGFGLYYRKGKCARYREASELIDVAYAYVWFFFGTGLCLSIVWCNLAVTRALRRLGQRAGHIRRMSRGSSKTKPLLAVLNLPSEIISTVEEKAFAKLMTVFSISFVVCWMPQMISIPLEQYSMKLADGATIARRSIRVFHVISDVLLCIHFTLDPYIYVLLRRPRQRFVFFNPLRWVCWSDQIRADSLTEITDHHENSGDSPTPMTDASLTPVSEQHKSHLVAIAV